jgi:hypothetical protein
MTRPNPAPTRLAADQVFRLHRTRLTRLAGRAGGRALSHHAEAPASRAVARPAAQIFTANRITTKETR